MFMGKQNEGKRGQRICGRDSLGRRCLKEESQCLVLLAGISLISLQKIVCHQLRIFFNANIRVRVTCLGSAICNCSHLGLCDYSTPTLFDEVYGMKAEGITESYSSKGWEWTSSSAGGRKKGAAPVLFKNHVQTRMEKYKVVPVEKLCKQRVTSPSLVFVDSSKKRDSWDYMVENIKKHHGNGGHEGLTFHFMQPNVSDVPSPDLGIKQDQLKIYDSFPPSGSFEETNPQVFVGKYGGYSKRTRFPQKGQSVWRSQLAMIFNTFLVHG